MRKTKLQVNQNLLKSLAAVLSGLIAGAVLMLLTRNNPILGYLYLFMGGLMNLERLGNTLATSAPLILTGLSVAFAFRTGLFNIGSAGQMLFGGFCATIIGLKLNLPGPLLIVTMIFAAMLGGAFWAFIPGIIKAYFNVHEVVSSIMMNWICFWIVNYAVPAYLKGEYQETESAQLPTNATLKSDWLSSIFHGSYINFGIFIALLAVIIIAFILNKTVLGYELKAVGYNRHAAEYAGINVNRSIVISLAISGALAGLAGVTFYAGNSTCIQIGVLPSQGFDGIAVSLLGINSPYGVLGSAIFFGLLYSGKGFMNAMTQIPPEIADTIIAIIIYFAATSVLMEKLLKRFFFKKGGDQ